MRKKDMDNILPLEIPEGLTIHTQHQSIQKPIKAGMASHQRMANIQRCFCHLGQFVQPQDHQRGGKNGGAFMQKGRAKQR